MLNQAAKPVPEQEELVAMANATLAEHQRVLQLTRAALAETQIAIDRIERDRLRRLVQ